MNTPVNINTKTMTSTDPVAFTSELGKEIRAFAMGAAKSSVKNMTSKEIAELTGKEHKNVIRDIRLMLDDLKKNGSELSHHSETLDARGYVSEISLSKSLTMTLVSGYSVVLRKRIIDRWIELEQVVLPAPVVAVQATDLDALAMIPTAMTAAAAFGFTGDTARHAASNAIQAMTGFNPLAMMGQPTLAVAIQEPVSNYCTPGELGRNHGISAIRVNSLLMRMGYQDKIDTVWVPSGLGKPHAEWLDTQKCFSGGSSLKQLKWLRTVFSEVPLGAITQ